MKKQIKRSWSLWLALCMLASLFAVMPVAAAETGAVTITSPQAGSYLEKGDQVILTATAAEAVTFYADDVLIGQAALKDGVWSCAWTPSYFGEVTITAKAGAAETSQTVEVMKSAEQSGVWGMTGSYLNGSAPTYTGGDGRTPAYALSGEKAVDTYHSTTPKITMVKGGIYALEMDVYTTADGDGATVAVSSAPNTMSNSMNLVIMSGTDLLQGKNGTVFAEEVLPKSGWCTLKLIVDMSGNTNVYDVYLNGRQYAKAVQFSKSDYTVVGRIKLQLTNLQSSANFMDNVRLSTLTKSTGEYQFTATPADGTFLEAGETVMLTAQVKDENDELQTCSKADFYVDDVLVGSGTKLKNGSYGYAWTPDGAGSFTVRAEVTANGRQFSEKRTLKVLDSYFKSAKTSRDAITPNKGTVVVNNGGAEASTSNAGDTAVAIKMTGFKEQSEETGSNPYVQQQTGGAAGDASGIVISEFDFSVENKAQGVRVYNRPTDSSSLTDVGVRLAGGKVYVGTASGTNADTGYTYEAKQTYTVKIVWNLDAGTKDVYLDGVQVQHGASIRFSSGRNLWQIRYELADTMKASGSVVLKNETLRYLSAPPQMVSQTVLDSSGSSLSESNRTPEKISSIAVSFNQALQAATVNTNTVKLYRGKDKSVEVTDITVSLKDSKTIQVKPKAGALLPSAEYVLVIGTGVLNALGAAAEESTYSFRTIADGSGIYNGSFAVSGNTVTFTAKAIHTKAEKAYLVVTVTNENGADKRIKAMSVTPFDFKAGQEIPITGTLTLESALAEGDVLRAFVWDESIMAFGDAFEQ